MLHNKILQSRKSVREYKSKSVNNKELAAIISYANEIEEKYSNGTFEFLVFENGKEIFNKLDGIAGYNGVMIKSPHYLGVQINKNDNESLIKTAFYTEQLITKAYELEIGTCWISMSAVNEEIRKSLIENKNSDINYLISLGYPKEKVPFVPNPSSSRLSIEDIVYKDEVGNDIDIKYLENRNLDELFYHIKNAPSYRNSQPWRFIIKDNKVLIAIKDVSKVNNLIDAGIIMYYFEKMSHEIGYRSTWEIAIEKSLIDKEFTVIAKINL